MTDPEQERERSELERRAFARDGSGLSKAEAARLSELRRAATPVSAGASLPAEPTAAAPPLRSSPPAEPGEDISGALPVPAGSASARGQAFRAWLATGAWKRPRFVLGGLAAILVVGLLAGWAIPRPPQVGLALRAGEGAREAAILKQHDDLDPGTLQLLAREHDGLLWYATQANGMLRCAILDVRGATPRRECQTVEQLRQQPLVVSPQTFTDQHDGYQATLAIAGTGVPLGILMRFQGMFSGGDLQDPARQREQDRVMAENHFTYAMVVGRVGDARVWVGDDGSGNRCMVVADPDPQKACSMNAVGRVFDGDGRAETSSEGPPLTLRLRETAAHPAVRLEYWISPMDGQYLVITDDDVLFPPADRAAD